MVDYTFEQINDICKQPERVESLLEQRDVFRKELKERGIEHKQLREKVNELEKRIAHLEPIVNELQICS